ncbi:PIN domain-containing protein [Nocardia otitidiscaviarum]|uniref:PIN domain-containing protein n=1 Tax=Nocardia otitidiscaviarum TaxID=1823 RepID=UPI001892F22F|nr:PIN domain-containing protein [Nocardia otitidiscaviarum]MBF6178437.1 VapC toxin family PIN domain ribonuclease [Nocardia otitidiscaviarum]
MGRRLILDTGVVIAAERAKLDLATVLRADDDIAIAMITASELYLGVELADAVHQGARKAFVDAFIAATPVEDHTLDVARAHARLMAYVRRTGQPRGAHDLIIAATAAATRRTVVTTDTKANLGALPEVDCLTC